MQHRETNLRRMDVRFSRIEITSAQFEGTFASRPKTRCDALIQMATPIFAPPATLNFPQKSRGSLPGFFNHFMRADQA